MASDKRIPALVVSGFLGSGKTTLVRRLLAEARAAGDRVAFVSNELGELGIDRALVRDASGGGEPLPDGYVEIAGGCVCCALNDELYDTLILLRARMDPDRIVIETSGVAIPSDVQLTFYQPPIRDWINEEAVVTVVNAEQLALGRDLDGVFVEQLETADLAILNKVDLVDGERVSELVAATGQTNPGMPVITAVHCDVDLRLLFARSARSPSHADPCSDPPVHQDPVHQDPVHQNIVDHSHADHAHLHDVFQAAELRFEGDHDLALLDDEIRELGAARVKGFVIANGLPHVVQGVGRRVEIVPAEGPVDADLLGRVVVIRRA